ANSLRRSCFVTVVVNQRAAYRRHAGWKGPMTAGIITAKQVLRLGSCGHRVRPWFAARKAIH
ncbi:MAG: hypothetical protein ACRELF_28980, partial [Gemmataceae bacterium]